MIFWASAVLFFFSMICDSAKILSVLPSSSKSHFIYPNALLLELAANGHSVTVMSPFPMENPPENYKAIDISQTKTELDALLSTKENMQMNLISKLKFLYKNTLHMTNQTLQHPEMKELLKSEEKFDLIILDLFLTDALLGLATVFDCQVVAVSANGPHSWVNEVLGTPRPVSLVPHVHTDLAEKINLGRRLENEVFYFIEKLLMTIYHLPLQEQLFNEVFINSSKTFDEIRTTTVAVALINSYFSISFPKPFLPNTIEIAGMQINEDELNPLADDLREFIENSKHGVLFFSLGGNAKASMKDPDKKKDLVKALSQLKQNTIWQYDDESLEVDTRKIMVRKWLPQYEILGHSNTKLFITNAELLSCTEAIHFAKNMIAVPIFGDQPRNARKIANLKLGIHLDFYLNFTGTSLTWAVNEILSNPVYEKSMRDTSRQFRDKPITAIETGKFWVEHVLNKSKNLTHIHSSSLRMSFIELHNWDVYIIIALIMLLLLSIPFYGIKKVFLACRNARRPVKSKTN